jgi:hypothetical protein
MSAMHRYSCSLKVEAEEKKFVFAFSCYYCCGGRPRKGSQSVRACASGGHTKIANQVPGGSCIASANASGGLPVISASLLASVALGCGAVICEVAFVVPETLSVCCANAQDGITAAAASTTGIINPDFVIITAHSVQERSISSLWSIFGESFYFSIMKTGSENLPFS